MSLNQDAIFMVRALKLAEKGKYTTDPNPQVGCVLVKDNEILAEGWHKKAGGAHAEVNALNKVSNAKDSTAYVTLEPCSHTGRTGPCCDALITAGVKRVVVAMKDPNPLVAGKGIKKMQAAGLTVECGLLQQDAELLNQGYIKRMTTGLPFVRSKLAMSLDGRTAMASGESQWITGAEARADVQRLRAESSVILTGISTVLADDPSLNARVEGDVVQPIRVVLDSQLRMPATAKMLGLEGQTWILTCSNDKQKIAILEEAGCQIYQLHEKQDKIDLDAVIAFLGQQQMNTVLVETGAILNGALLDADCVDEWVIYMASCILGDQGRGLFSLPKLQKMADKKTLAMTGVRHVGSDLKFLLKR
jgi:diaminohydroxyphosphoribosylaminopyrimidine deaminase/5-amino-6-(5-phosphoribosylamino)uracil reductase